MSDTLGKLNSRIEKIVREWNEAIVRVPTLTRRESGVFRLLGLGLSNREIAENLHISLCTVRSHMKKIHAKCGLREREKLAVTSYQSFQQELAAKMAESDSPQQLRLHPSEYAVRGLIPVCPS